MKQELPTYRTAAARHSPPPRAMTLVEVMVVVAVSALVLGVAISFAARLQQWDQRFRDTLPQNDQAVRLIEIIRADIRKAADVVVGSPTNLVVTGSDQHSIQYELGSEGCRRTEFDADKSPNSNELFRIGAAGRWKLDRGTGGRLPLAVVAIERSATDSTEATAMPLAVYAAIGADRTPATQPPLERRETPPQ